LYIFGDISRKNYLLKKKVIEDKLIEIRSNFEAQAKASDDEALEDLLLLENTTSFFLQQNISGDKEIDYEKLSGLCGQKVLKDFLNQVIETITVKNGNIISIKFKNGMEHKILY
jgi:hypothetical protein